MPEQIKITVHQFPTIVVKVGHPDDEQTLILDRNQAQELFNELGLALKELKP